MNSACARTSNSANPPAVVGEVLGKYHPHGDAAVYDSMVRMAQDFAMRYPLIDGQGNFGSMDGDAPAAMRYTEARMMALAEEILSDIDKDTVDWMDNYDAHPERTERPAGESPEPPAQRHSGHCRRHGHRHPAA